MFIKEIPILPLRLDFLLTRSVFRNCPQLNLRILFDIELHVINISVPKLSFYTGFTIVNKFTRLKLIHRLK